MELVETIAMPVPAGHHLACVMACLPPDHTVVVSISNQNSTVPVHSDTSRVIQLVRIVAGSVAARRHVPITAGRRRTRLGSVRATAPLQVPCARS